LTIRYRVSADATRDIVEIYKYGYVSFGEAQATRYNYDLEQAFQLLADFPGAGRLLADVQPATRMHPKGMHVIIYRHLGSSIEVLRVFHSAEDWINKL
jgi:toxin ParE1/3/4